MRHEFQEVWLTSAIPLKVTGSGNAQRLHRNAGGAGDAGNAVDLYAEDVAGLGLTVFVTSTRGAKACIPWHLVQSWTPWHRVQSQATEGKRKG